MTQFSFLDLAPVPEGKSTAEALSNTTDLAQNAENAGYHRYWLAEHHNMPGIASAATSVLIGHVAAATTSMRIGAGGIMLPNHAPLMVAEQFGTLATLYPDRIDLGLGRAPGSDMQTTRALRRNKAPDDSFPQDVQELQAYFGQGFGSVQAVPGTGTKVPLWILGSSLYGAQLAAALGLPYAFASHFAPDHLAQALEIYRAQFKPSDDLEKPHAMMAIGVCAADTDEEAKVLQSSQILAFARLMLGNPGKLPKPTHDLDAEVPAQILACARHALSCSATGSKDTVAAQLDELTSTYEPDEILLTSMIYDHDARVRSVRMAADVLAA